MGSSYPTDYSSVPTPELERLYSQAVRPEEKRAIEQELNRRYRYAEPGNKQRQRPAGGFTEPRRRPTEGSYEQRSQASYSQRVPPPPTNGSVAPPNYSSASKAKRQRFPSLGLRRVNILAIVSPILSLVWVYWLGSIAGLVIGLIALQQIKARNEAGRGLAIAGIVIAGISLAMVPLLLVAAMMPY